MRLFDTHCHLGLDAGGDPAAERDRALAAGVSDLVIVGIDLDSSARARDLARGLPGARWSAGLHPNSASRFDDEWPRLRELARTADCCAIGETGLDYFRDRASPAEQARSLAAHRELAAELGLPLILHCRDALPAMYEQLAAHAPIRGVVHCFSGDGAQARQAVELGLHVSFAGPLSYPNNHELRRAAAVVPTDRLLIETDAPFLPPQGHRGRRNEPALVALVAAALAQARGWTIEQAASVTHDNAVALFGAGA